MYKLFAVSLSSPDQGTTASTCQLSSMNWSQSSDAYKDQNYDLYF